MQARESLFGFAGRDWLDYNATVTDECVRTPAATKERSLSPCSWRASVSEFEIELEIGDVLQVGGHSLTLIDIDGQTICVQIENHGEGWCSEPEYAGDLLGA